MKKYIVFPWILTLPLLMGAFGFGVFVHGTDSPFYAPSLFLLLLFGGFSFYDGLKSGFSLPRSPVVFLMLAYWLYLAVSLLWSTALFTSSFFFFIFSMLPFLFFTLLSASEPEKRTMWHCHALWAALGLLAIWILMQFFVFYPDYGVRPHHPMLNPNSMAGLLNMGLLPAVALFMSVKSRRNILLSFCFFVLLYVALLLTQSRGAVLSFLLTAFILLPFMVRPFSAQKFKLLIIMAAILIVPFLLNAYGVYFLDRDMIRAAQFGAGSASLVDRVALWSSSWRMILDHFWTGTGLGTFYYYYPSYRLPVDSSDGFFAHMDPLQFWAEMGVLAPVLFYSILTAILFRTIRALNVLQDTDPLMKARILGAFGGMLALTLHTHITFHLYILVMMYPMGCLLAYWYVATEKVLGHNRLDLTAWVANKKKPVVALGFLFFFLPSVWLLQMALSGHFVHKAGAQMRAGNLEQARIYAEYVTAFAPPGYFRAPEYEALWRIQKLRTQNSTLSIEEQRVLYEEAHAFLEEAIQKNKGLVNLSNLQAKLYFFAQGTLIDDGYEKAVVIMEDVLRRNPLFLDARMGLSMIYKRQGELRKALRVLEGGLLWPRAKGYPDINFMVTTAQLRLQLGDKRGHDALIAQTRARAQIYGLTTNISTP